MSLSVQNNAITVISGNSSQLVLQAQTLINNISSPPTVTWHGFKTNALTNTVIVNNTGLVAPVANSATVVIPSTSSTVLFDSYGDYLVTTTITVTTPGMYYVVFYYFFTYYVLVYQFSSFMTVTPITVLPVVNNATNDKLSGTPSGWNLDLIWTHGKLMRLHLSNMSSINSKFWNLNLYKSPIKLKTSSLTKPNLDNNIL